jgi:UDP-N-acetylglucosamine--N-acetylmuramyl-(pentapeptide) pyrophosphoryl-undecaprenol N-acetylglucosamine transferase
MAAAYSAADLAISRSGAGVMAELAAAGLPSILVPLPGSAGNHQELNARSFERKGAAVMVRQDPAVTGNVAQALFSLIGNARRRKEMARRILECARPEAGQVIAGDLIATLEEETGINKG